MATAPQSASARPSGPSAEARREAASRIVDLVTWMAGPAPDMITPEVRMRAALVLTDDIGAMAAGASVAEVSNLHCLLAARPGEPEASVIGNGLGRIRREEAAFANAVAANWCELDEGFRPLACHAGLYTVPAVIAEAEATGQPIATLLDAIAIGYEAAARFALAFTGGTSGVHPHAGLSAIGATAALTHLRNWPATKRVSALSAAATMAAPGPWSHATAGYQIRNAWAGHGAVTAFRVLTAVEAGMDGDPAGAVEVLHDILGRGVLESFNPNRLSESLGDGWAVEQGYHKLYACCQYAHAAVHAALSIRAGGLPDGWIEDVETIEVATHPLALKLDNPNPQTDLAARFSLPHAVAVTLADGRADQAAFASHRLADPLLARLRHRVQLSPIEPLPDPPMDRPAEVTLVLRGGRTFKKRSDSAPGSPDCPLSREDILAKAGAFLGERNDDLATLLRLVTALEPTVLVEPWRVPVVRN